MAEPLQLIAGSEVRCTDGRVGHVRGLIVDPRTRAVTHLSVDASSVIRNGRLVPVSTVQSGGAVIQLGCTREDYYKLPENEELLSAVGPGPRVATLHVHLVPHEERELTEKENIHAVDGRAGHVVGVSVDRETHGVQGFLGQIGHLSGRRQVSIPVEAVTDIDQHGIHTGLSKNDLSGPIPT